MCFVPSTVEDMRLKPEEAMENRPFRPRPVDPPPPSPQKPLTAQSRTAHAIGAEEKVDPDGLTSAPQDSNNPESQFHALGSTRILGEGSPTSGNASHPGGGAGKESFGDFELIKKLGEGAMGEVWQARQISFDRLVALKVLFPHVAKNNKLVRRLEREGQVLGKLEHPNIVEAYAVDTAADGRPYVAMELVDGDNLQQWLTRLGRFTIGDALAITLACARALAYAHGEGMVHRDIKPDNVLIDRRGTVKVADLGMVKALDEDQGLTQTGHAVGTPWYMPLEQARMAKEADGRCDIYALGCLLYCLLTGNPPFNGRTIVEVIEAKEIGTFPPARSVNPEVPERLDLIIAKMTAKLPRYRYANCAELIKDLEGLGLASAKLGFLEGKTAPAASPKTPVSPPSYEGPADDWYVRVHLENGEVAVRKVTASQLKKMLEEGTIDPAAQASRQRRQGYRSLATYKEFQGTAFVKQSKKGADMQTTRFRTLYKKIEEKERQRDEEEKKNDVTPSYYSLLWKPSLLISAAVVGAALFLYILYRLLA
jgi:serine/threonine-protein kinase